MAERGRLPTEKAAILIKKYGPNGTHLEKQRAAIERLKNSRPMAPPPMPVAKPRKERAAEQAQEDASQAQPAEAQS